MPTVNETDNLTLQAWTSPSAPHPPAPTALIPACPCWPPTWRAGSKFGTWSRTTSTETRRKANEAAKWCRRFTSPGSWRQRHVSRRMSSSICIYFLLRCIFSNYFDFFFFLVLLFFALMFYCSTSMFLITYTRVIIYVLISCRFLNSTWAYSYTGYSFCNRLYKLNTFSLKEYFNT